MENWESAFYLAGLVIQIETSERNDFTKKRLSFPNILNIQ